MSKGCRAGCFPNYMLPAKAAITPIECQRFSVVGFLTVIFIITYFYKNDKLFSKSLQNLLRTDKKSSFSAKAIRYSCKTRSAKEGKRRGAFPLCGALCIKAVIPAGADRQRIRLTASPLAVPASPSCCLSKSPVFRCGLLGGLLCLNADLVSHFGALVARRVYRLDLNGVGARGQGHLGRFGGESGVFAAVHLGLDGDGALPLHRLLVADRKAGGVGLVDAVLFAIIGIDRFAAVCQRRRCPERWRPPW